MTTITFISIPRQAFTEEWRTVSGADSSDNRPNRARLSDKLPPLSSWEHQRRKGLLSVKVSLSLICHKRERHFCLSQSYLSPKEFPAQSCVCVFLHQTNFHLLPEWRSLKQHVQSPGARLFTHTAAASLMPWQPHLMLLRLINQTEPNKSLLNVAQLHLRLYF